MVTMKPPWQPIWQYHVVRIAACPMGDTWPMHRKDTAKVHVSNLVLYGHDRQWIYIIVNVLCQPSAKVSSMRAFDWVGLTGLHQASSTKTLYSSLTRWCCTILELFKYFCICMQATNLLYRCWKATVLSETSHTIWSYIFIQCCCQQKNAKHTQHDSTS